MTDENRANIARLEERIDGQKANLEEKLSGASKAIYLLLEIGNKDRDDLKQKSEQQESRILELENELARMQQQNASATQVKVATISALASIIVAAIAFAQVFLGN